MGSTYKIFALSVVMVALCLPTGAATETIASASCRPLLEANVKLGSIEQFQVIRKLKYLNGKVVHRELVVVGAKAYQRSDIGSKYVESNFVFRRDGLPKDAVHSDCVLVGSEHFLGKDYDIWDYRFSYLDEKWDARQALTCHTWLDHQTGLPLKRRCVSSQPDSKISALSLFWSYRKRFEAPTVEATSSPQSGR
ncbi:hypothetical protein [Labrys okinawensis]|uniref:hypothetical protein n=1 Tax=Labrys okinawensis TaxID=346911 RepID=UPI0011B28EF8|nr:hypothetical protein [Labrys okinawensis]